MNKNYHLGLLYLVKLLVDADGVADAKELEAIRTIKRNEKIPDDTFDEFEKPLHTLRERDIYERGINLINNCTREEKLNAFSTLYCLSEVDGRVHVKEIKLLLYSIKSAGVEFDDVVNHAKTKKDFLK
ncbi:MAG TPA: hypothetical protein VGK59_01895 [Ohtaekwangia sp.]